METQAVKAQDFKAKHKHGVYQSLPLLLTETSSYFT